MNEYYVTFTWRNSYGVKQVVVMPETMADSPAGAVVIARARAESLYGITGLRLVSARATS